MKIFRNILVVLALVLLLNIGLSTEFCVSIEDPEPWSVEPIETV